jgi:quinolinate synthase
MSDIICTSSNAEKIIFAPDKFLGGYLNKKTGRNMLLWDGSCQVHEIFSEKELVKLKVRYPNSKVLAHPECDENILLHADFIGSTTAIINYAKTSKEEEFIIATESGVIHQMQKQNPQKRFIPLPSKDGCACNECPHMRLNTLEKMVNALETLSPQIYMSEDKRLAALKPLERMLELS